MNQVREAAVAGQFYPGSKTELLREVQGFLGSGLKKKIRALGVIAPHAGYIYSGAVAGAVYAHVEVPRRVIVLCPNHTGMGEPLSIMSAGSFRTPLGEIEIDAPLAEALKKEFPLLREDSAAQAREHAVEVQLPFLQAARSDVKFVPITVGTGQFEVLTALGVVLAKVIAECGDPVLIVASSDMNHYEDDAETRVKDALALRLGATSAELVKYATSGDVSGDREHVVGYAGIAIL